MANYQERREKMSTAKKTLSVITAVAIFAIAALMTMCYAGRISGRDER